jgi:uncharacterized membrane protein
MLATVGRRPHALADLLSAAASAEVRPTAQLLPDGFALPPAQYFLLVLAAVGIAALALGLTRPAVNRMTVVAFAPWMAAGAGLYALYQIGAVAEPLAPLFGSPTVYLTTFTVMGLLWAVAASTDRDPRFATAIVLVGGLGLMSAVLGLSLVVGLASPPLRLVWPGIGLVVAAGLAALVWFALGRLAPEATDTTGVAGQLAVFSHALDGVSTAVGVDVLGFGEQTPLSRMIIEASAALPTEPLLGSAWLFVLVKLTLAAAVVALLADYVREQPTEGLLLLAAVAAVGLGPGVHNLVLFAVAPPSATAAALVTVSPPASLLR